MERAAGKEDRCKMTYQYSASSALACPCMLPIASSVTHFDVTATPVIAAVISTLAMLGFDHTEDIVKVLDGAT